MADRAVLHPAVAGETEVVMIRRRDLEVYLRNHGASFLRHGAKHDVWIAPKAARPVTIPRHSRIPRSTARVICKQLGLPPLL
jgi:hypothetical protein